MQDFRFLFEVICSKPYRFTNKYDSRLIRCAMDIHSDKTVDDIKIAAKKARCGLDSSYFKTSENTMKEVQGLCSDAQKICFHSVPDVSGKEIADFEDAIPPFNNFFVEFPPDDRGEIECFHIVALARMEDYLENGWDEPGVEMVASRFSFADGEYFGPSVTTSIYIGADGKVKDQWGVYKEDQFEPKDAVDRDLVNEICRVDRDYAKRLLYVYSMLNCQNITTVSGGFTDDGIGHKRRRKERRPHIEYKVLRVQTGKHKFQVLGRASSGESADLPLHVVRGHFATYTEDRPMFGRPGEFGRYWIPAHTRGKKKHGEVVKTYEVA